MIRNLLIIIYFCVFWINNSKYTNITHNNSDVSNTGAQNILKTIVHIKNKDIKNHCLKLDFTWYKYISHLRCTFLKKYKNKVKKLDIPDKNIKTKKNTASLGELYGSK